MFVLWWIPFHTTWLSNPVVTLLPTVKINFLSKAYFNSYKTSLPYGVLGKYAILDVPWKFTPLRIPEWNL